MEPVTLILVFSAVGILGGVLISEIKRLHREKYGEVESHRQIAGPAGGDGGAQNANQCKVPHARGQESPPPTGERPYSGDRPYAGRASVLTFQWMYIVKKNESPGSIAQAVTGDPKRYIELLSANSSRRMTSYRKGTTVEVNFAKDQFCEGDRLYVPKSWNPWIDEVGDFAGENGRTRPYPPYDILANYPIVDPSRITAGFVPWPPPPAQATGWGAIPLPALPPPGVEP
jgi:hypothetical protein